MDRRRLRTVFNQVPELYQRARPAYPQDVVDALVDVARPGRNARVLEIGPGTGQLTVPLARTGATVTALELGAGLAAVARGRLEAFPDVDVVVGAFEEWRPPSEPFDLVVAASAFHWLDPDVRVRKALDVLRPGGALVVLDTHHVAGGTEQFFADAQECYERWDPATPPGLRLTGPEALPSRRAELEGYPRVASVDLRCVAWEVCFSTQQYRELLLTYSGHRALDGHRREGLLSCIATLIEAKYGGQVTKRFFTQVWGARRV